VYRFGYRRIAQAMSVNTPEWDENSAAGSEEGVGASVR
jgi:hypothetical protein